MTNSSGAIVARYDYDPWGNTTLVQGTDLATFQYAGMMRHQTSGLYMTLYRIYNAHLGAWYSRDPEGEGSDATLYSYVANNPISLVDPLGLDGQMGPQNGQGGVVGPSEPPIINIPSEYVVIGGPLAPLAVSSAPLDLSLALATRMPWLVPAAAAAKAAANGSNGQSGTCPAMTEAQAAAAALGKGPLAIPGAPLTPQMIQALKNNLAAAQANVQAALSGVKNGQSIPPQLAQTMIRKGQDRINEINQVLNSGVQAPKN